MFIATIFYTLSTIVLGALVGSYIIAYFLKRSISVLSFLLFFIAVFFISLSITINLFLCCYDLRIINYSPLIEFRAIGLFISATFLLYTSWYNKTKQDKI